MGNIKMLALTALVALPVIVCAGAGTASATALYKYTTPSANEKLGSGTTIQATLTGGTTKLTSTSGTLLDTCTGGEVDGKIDVAGSSTTTVTGDLENLTWTGCLEPTETSFLGGLEIHHIAGTTDGTVKAFKSTSGNHSTVKVNTTIFGAVCEFTGVDPFDSKKPLDLGVLSGSGSSTGNATLHITVVVPAKNSFFCPDANWQADYKVTNPVGLIVEAS